MAQIFAPRALPFKMALLVAGRKEPVRKQVRRGRIFARATKRERQDTRRSGSLRRLLAELAAAQAQAAAAAEELLAAARARAAAAEEKLAAAQALAATTAEQLAAA